MVGPQFSKGCAIGFFDGASQRGVGGYGALLKVNEYHHFHLLLGYGQASNTKAELLAF